MNTWKKSKKNANQPVKRPAMAGEGFFGRGSYYFRRAIHNIRQNVFVNIVTVATIALALLIVSLFLLVFINMESAAENWSERVQVTVYFDRDLSAQDQASFRGKIGALPGVSRISYVSRDEALKRFKERLRGQETLLEGVRPEILPTSLEITLKSDSRDTLSVERFVTALKRIQGISEIQYGEEWVRRFNLFLNYMRLLGGLLGAFLVVTVLFIISNTIKLTIYARREELEVMSLVGATRFFIKAPFLLEGLIQGGAGASVAILLLFGLYELFVYNADSILTFNPVTSGLIFLPVEYLGALLLAGVLLGFLGSLTSLRRFITI